MRLSTRVALGAALAALPMVGVVAYSVERLQNLATHNERLASRHVLAVEIGSGIIVRLDRFGEFQRKRLVSNDPGYLAKLKDTISAIDDEVVALRAAELAPTEAEALERFSRHWGELASLALGESASEPDPTGTTLFARLEEVAALAHALLQETRNTAEEDARAATRAREEIRSAAVLVSAVALIASALVLFITVRALRVRLDAFIRATEAVSRGEFDVQIEDAGKDELGLVARAFNHMVLALRQLDRMKADFVSSVSHELKTPIVAMLETNELLLDEVAGPLTEKQRRMLTLNRQAARRLSGMITDLLDLSVLQARMSYRMSDEDLAVLSARAVSELEALALERGIRLETNLDDEGHVIAACDPERFTQVVQNLVENGLKYTPEGGLVRVSLGLLGTSEVPGGARQDRRRDDVLLAHLVVEDSGPGIPPEDRQRVFGRFVRGTPAHGTGVGLGLAICREIVEAHGGTIWADASSLGGAALHVALPLTSGLPRPSGGKA